ncbi:MAG: hypothetical protein Q9162_004294 [Coniocarpon cinnabarinum]
MAVPNQEPWPPPRASPPIDPLLSDSPVFSSDPPGDRDVVFSQTGWQEPPLRPSQPSFMDHGGDRVGVLEGMMPLGTQPTSRAKAKARADPVRRAMHTRAQEGMMVMDDLMTTPDQSNAEDNTRATSMMAEEQSRTDTSQTGDNFRPVQQLDVSSPVAELGARAGEEQLSMPTSLAQPLSPFPPSSATQPSPGFPHPAHPAFLSPPTFYGNSPFSFDHGALAPPGPPIQCFEHGIRTAISRRPDLHSAIDAIYAAAIGDPDFKMLLALRAQIQGATPEQAKALRRKIRRLKKVFHEGQTRLQKSTSGEADKESPPPNHVDPQPAQPPHNPETPAAPDQLPPQPTSTVPTPTPPPPARPRTPTLKLTFNVKNRLQPSVTSRTTRSHTPQPTASPLRQSTKFEEQVARPKRKPMSSSHQAGGESDSDLSSVNQDITEQDQSTFLNTGNDRHLRGHKRKASQDLAELPDETTARVKRPSHRSPNEFDDRRQRYDRSITTDTDLHKDGLVSQSSLRPELSDANRIQDFITPLSSPDKSRQKLKTPLAHLDPAADASSALTERPVPTALGRPKKVKTPKVKTPRKMGVDPQRRVVLAGRPELHDNNRRSSGNGNGSGGSSNATSAADNSDYCAACGGEGYLVCCDGPDCKRSFHFNCVSPPIQDIAQIGESWHCDDCRARIQREEADKLWDYVAPEDSLFGPLLQALTHKNPQAFALPEELRHHYPEVATGANGEYLEAHLSSSRSTNRRGGATGTTADPPYDYFRTHDPNTNERITCRSCTEPARHPDRPIVSCDYCSTSWHFECLDPPRSYHPHKYANENRHRQLWMCPLHVGHDLTHIDELEQDRGVRRYKPTHRMRFPRQVQTVRSALTKGVQNNGNIDITFDSDDESYDSDDSEPEYPMASRIARRQHDNTVRYSLSDTDVVLDFIHKVKSDKVVALQQDYVDAVKNLNAAARIARKSEYQDLKNLRLLEQKLDERSLGEQQAALKMVQMAVGEEAGVGLGGEGIGELVRTLIAEAPDAVTKPRPAARTTRSSAPKVNGVIGTRSKNAAKDSEKGPELTDEQAAELESLSTKLEAILARHRSKQRGTRGKRSAGS